MFHVKGFKSQIQLITVMRNEPFRPNVRLLLPKHVLTDDAEAEQMLL